MWVFEEILPTGKKLSESINQANVRVQTNSPCFILLLESVNDSSMILAYYRRIANTYLV